MLRTEVSRRRFLQGAAVVAAGGMLSACDLISGDEDDGTPPAEEVGRIEYWVGWSELTPFFDKLKASDGYQELMGGTDVRLKPAVAYEALLTAVAAGQPPDIASEAPYLDLMARGVLQPIDDLASQSAIIREGDFIEGNWERGKFEGQLYGVPALECFVRFGLDYNARLAEGAGLDPETPPVTWDECLEWHKAITEFDGAGNLVRFGLDPYDAEGAAINDGFFAAKSWGFDWYDGEARQFNLNNEGMIEAFGKYADFYRVVGPENMEAIRGTEGLDTWGGSFNAEVQAMIIEGYWHPGETSVQQPDVAQFNRATWGPVPEARRGVKVQGTGGHYVIFFRESDRASAAFKFAEFLNTDAAFNMVFENVGWLPAYLPFIESVDASVYPGLDFYLSSVSEADEIAPPAQCPITAFVQDQYARLADDVNKGKRTSAEAAGEFQARAEDELVNTGFAR